MHSPCSCVGYSKHREFDIEKVSGSLDIHGAKANGSSIGSLYYYKKRLNTIYEVAYENDG